MDSSENVLFPLSKPFVTQNEANFINSGDLTPFLHKS